MHVCMYMCIHAYMNVYVYIYKYIYVGRNTCLYVCIMYECMYAYIYVHACISSLWSSDNVHKSLTSPLTNVTCHICYMISHTYKTMRQHITLYEHLGRCTVVKNYCLWVIFINVNVLYCLQMCMDNTPLPTGISLLIPSRVILLPLWWLSWNQSLHCVQPGIVSLLYWLYLGWPVH